MTFLAYVVHELLGPPACGVDNWHCPFCDPDRDSKWASFTVLPPMGLCAIKWKCHKPGCPGFNGRSWGDEHDLLLHLHPGEKNRDFRRLRLAELKEQFLRDCKDSASTLGEVGKELVERLEAKASAASSPIAQRGKGKIRIKGIKPKGGRP